MKSRCAWFTVLAAMLVAPLAASADEPTPAAAPSAPPAIVARQEGGPRPADRLDLDATAIRGNQELPKVLYIVPWKEPGLAEPAGRPLNSLVDEALAPLDREVFRRQMNYFDQLYAPTGASAGAGGAAP